MLTENSKLTDLNTIETDFLLTKEYRPGLVWQSCKVFRDPVSLQLILMVQDDCKNYYRHI